MVNIRYGYYLVEYRMDPHSMFCVYECEGIAFVDNGFETEEEAQQHGEQKSIELDRIETRFEVNTYSYDAGIKMTDDDIEAIKTMAGHRWYMDVLFEYKHLPVEEVKKILD